MANITTKNLYKLQSFMTAAIMRPLENDNMQKVWIDGHNTSDYAVQFIKSNKRLTSFERLAIYNKQYWYRLLESLQDDFPGLNAALGHKNFERLSIAYLTAYPSKSYEINYLGQDLAKFIQDNPELTSPHCELAYDMACVEWAEIKAFDASAKCALNPELLKEISPAEITLEIQPCVSVLKLNYAIDNFLLSLQKPYDKSIESNTIANRTIRFNKALSVKKQRVYLAVHRLNNKIYYKRLDKDKFTLLKSLLAGETLAQACNELIKAKIKIQDQEKLATKINKSFASWMELNWFCQ